MFPLTLPHLVGRTALVITIIAAFWRGSRPERIAVVVVALGWFITPIVQMRQSWYQPQLGYMSVDTTILLVFVVLAFRFNRYWTIFAAAFQAVAILTHFAFLINPHGLYRAYYTGNYAIGFLVLGSILGGVFIESRAPIHRPPRSGRRPVSD